MKRRWFGFGLALLIGTGAAQTAPRVVDCPAIVTRAVAVTVKNERGHVLNVLEELYFTPKAAGQVSVQQESRGRWTVTVQRRWYRPVTVRGVRVAEDECGPLRPTPLTVHLRPTPDAPRIREFSVFPASADGLFVGPWPYYQRLSTLLDAPPSVGRMVIWSSSNPAVATIDQSGMLRSVCSRTPARTTITATLKAEPAVKIGTRFGRGGGRMVCKRGAADC